MKKIVYFLLIALCLPLGLRAQSADDDLYFIPSKDKQEKKETPVRKEPKKQVTTNIYTSPGTTVVVQDRKGKTRDVDEYNRRYDARDNEFEREGDTLYIKEKANSDLDGEWVTGEFEGSQEDYEYAERIIRFRNPGVAISMSSPLYWDMVYGFNSWDWNVYADGFYAYAFPRFGTPTYWDWRYNSYGLGWNYGWGWNYGGGWNPYYAWGYYPGSWGGSYWGGWYGGGSWGHHHHHWGGGPSWGGVSRPYSGRSVLNANNRARYSNGSGSSYNRRGEGSRGTQGTGDRGTSNGRVVGTRTTNSRAEGSYNRGEASRRGSSTYTRPSSTRSNTSGTVDRGSSTYQRSSSTETRRSSSYNRGGTSYTRGSSPSSSSSGNSSYSRGSSTTTRSSSPSNTTSRSSSPSYTPSRSSSPSYNSSSSGSSSRSSGSSSGGSSRGSSSSGGSSRSSGGGSRR